LVMQSQPAEGVQLDFQTKVPDSEMRTQLTDLDFRFTRYCKRELPDAYQRLLLDALEGDASLFARADEVELSWGIIDPIQQTWHERDQPPLPVYPKGEWGPPSCMQWMSDQGRQWFDTCPVIQ
ncbi:MAG: glucose-6-phosphate dehydrogenase, partial [Planctomycetes bacterium]|nr:glucose-6-phosphate dehydrogenase [Planctomycetota bacterium]